MPIAATKTKTKGMNAEFYLNSKRLVNPVIVNTSFNSLLMPVMQTLLPFGLAAFSTPRNRRRPLKK